MTSFLKNIRESLTPVLKESAFLSRGVLTPTEFISAGDNLVYKCPTWSWESGSKNLTRSHLPTNKQYLVTRNVPCSMRVASIEKVNDSTAFCSNIGDDSMVAGEGGDDEWMISGKEGVKLREKIEDGEFDLMEDIDDGAGKKEGGNTGTDTANTVTATATANSATNDQADEDEYADMAAFEVDDLAADTMTINIDNNNNNNNSTNNNNKEPIITSNINNSNVKKVRTYDVSITYDKYYQTPRVFLIGYSENGTPLTGEQMFEDVMTDYVRRTVTIERHPHKAMGESNLGDVCISIHPCQHGNVMKNIVGNIVGEGGNGGKNVSGEKGEIGVDSYMFIFLKFVSSIIPTVNYDFTMQVRTK